MKPEHYPSLERCKKLTEMGFPITQFVYEKHDIEKFEDSWKIYLRLGGYCKSWNTHWHLDSVYPSVMELLDEIQKWKISIHYSYPDWRVVPKWESSWTRDSYLPNALADMWIWLKENGHIE